MTIDIHIEAAATAIVGDGEWPSGLKKWLLRTSGTIEEFRKGEEAAPCRVPFRERLDEFRNHAAAIREDMTDTVFQAYLGYSWLSTEIRFQSMLDELEKLGNRAGEISMTFSGQGGEKRAYPGNKHESLSAKELCAGAISVAMQKIMPDQPVKAGDQRAWKAANALWMASGGMPLGDDKEASLPSGWRRHLTAVEKIREDGGSRANHFMHMEWDFDTIRP